MLPKIDRDALARCMEIAQKDRTLSARINGRPWLEAAEAACYSLQYDNLKLLPHQSPPSSVALDDDRDRDATELLRRLLAAGLSRYEPDPLKALR
jgi:hypothetical protein